MAFIIANPAAVGFWSAADTGTTILTWDGEFAGGIAAGNLFRSDNGGAEMKIAGPALSGVTTNADLHLGHTYKYILRNAGNLEIATATVTTYDAQKNFEALIVHDHIWNVVRPPQQIFDLKITPGIDSARITFRTAQETVPLITFTPQGGTPFTWINFFAGLQTKHEYVLGANAPLAQNKIHTFHISASGKKYDGTPMKATASGNFTTGSRHATVIFDRIKVDDDSDSVGAGELSFALGAGDADTGGLRGSHFWPETDVDTGHTLDVNLSIVIPEAPRSLWVQVNGRDDDSSIWSSFPSAGLSIIGMGPEFQGEGTHQRIDRQFDYSSVTRVFDISEITSLTTFPVELATGNLKLAFTVFCRLRIDAFVPAPITTREPPRFEAKPWFDLKVGGSMKHSGHRDGGFGHLVALGGDGAVFHKPMTLTDSISPDANWKQLGEPVTPPIKGLARSDGGLGLFALDREGGLLYQGIKKNSRESRWQRLGGRYRGEVAVTEGARGETEVFGLGEDGVVYHQTIPPDGKGKHGDWARIGGGVAGSVWAEAFADGTVGLFAMGQNGEVLHKRRRRNRWTPSGLEWETLGKANGSQLLVLRPVPKRGIGLATLSDDGEVTYVTWPDYPEGEPRRRWISMGTIDAWLGALPKRERGSEQKTSSSKKKGPAAKRKKPKPARKRAR